MPLSWKEITSKAFTFSKEWENEVSEDAEAMHNKSKSRKIVNAKEKILGKFVFC